MEVMWSPWRSKYIETFKDEEKKDKELCFFCDAWERFGEEKKLLVAERRELTFCMLNKFPYNNGHLLVAPIRHVSDINDLNDKELTELTFLVRDATNVLKNIYNPHGFNVGVNLGRTAGAGVPGHMHFHIVPRWNGDTSFMAVIDDVKVVSQSLEDTQVLVYNMFRELFH